MIPKVVKLVDQLHLLGESQVPQEIAPPLLELVVYEQDLHESSPPAASKQFVSEMCFDVARRHVPNHKPDR